MRHPDSTSRRAANATTAAERRAKAVAATKRMRAKAAAKGLSGMSLSQINRIIKRARDGEQR